MVSVAVAIPNLNGGKYLSETLQSLRLQIEKPDEIVISDNHSGDNSLEIVSMFADLNIRVVKPNKFLTMSENWNFVANQVASNWFFLLSNDDLLRNNAVKRLKEIANDLEPRIGVVSFKAEIINENSKLILGKYRIGKMKRREEYEFLRQNIKFLHINAACVAIKRDSWMDVGKFPDEYKVLHDLVFYQRVILKWGIVESKEVLGRYRIYSNRPDSAARSKLVEDDFLTYEKTDLKVYLERYPDLLEIYNCGSLPNSSLFLRRILSINTLRVLGLSLMTEFRRIQSIYGHTGYPK